MKFEGAAQGCRGLNNDSGKENADPVRRKAPFVALLVAHARGVEGYLSLLPGLPRSLRTLSISP